MKSMIDISEAAKDCAWQGEVLSNIGVIGLDHDTYYNRVIDQMGRLNPEHVKDGRCGLTKSSGIAELVAVMDDGSRVMVPDDGVDDDESIKVIKAMYRTTSMMNKVLSEAQPVQLDRFLHTLHTIKSAVHKYLTFPIIQMKYDGSDHNNHHSRYVHDLHKYLEEAVKGMKKWRRLTDDGLHLWIELMNSGVFVSLKQVLALERFIMPDGPLDRSMIPDFIIRKMEEDPERSPLLHLRLFLSLKDFKGNDHFAWAVVDYDLDGDSNMESRRRIADFIDMLIGPYYSHDDSMKLNRFLADGEDVKGLGRILSKLKFRNPSSLDWTLSILDKGKRSNWNVPKFLSLVSRENAALAGRIRATMIEAVVKHMEDDEPSGFDNFRYYRYGDTYATQEALKGAELLRDGSMIGTGPDDEHDEAKLGIMRLIGSVLNERDAYVSAFQVMTFMEDVSRANDSGISTMDLQNAIVEYASNCGKTNDYDMTVDIFKFVHWMTNLRPEYAQLPYSFYSQLPEYQDLVLA